MLGKDTRTTPQAFHSVVWEGVFDSEFLAQYYPMYEAKLRRGHDKTIRITIGLAVIASALLIIGLSLPSDQALWATRMTAAGLGSTIASIASTIWAYRGETIKNISLAATASIRWRHLAARWRILWAESRIGDDRVVDRCYQLLDEGRLIQLETECGAFDSKLSDQADKQARDFLEGVFQITD